MEQRVDKAASLHGEHAEKNREVLHVEVVYALPERQRILAVSVPRGTSAFDAALQSGIAREFPGLDLVNAPMGIFAKPLDGKTLPLPKDYEVKAGDRIEIYRPLLIDPKEARLARAAKARKAK